MPDLPLYGGISANLNQSCNFTLIKISNIEQGIMNVEIKPASKLEPLINENNELISIFVTSVKTAKEKNKKTS